MNDEKKHVALQSDLSEEDVRERIWVFNYPRIDTEQWDAFYSAGDLWHAGYDEEAEAAYRQLVADLPEFIDAHHHLAILLSETGREDEAFDIWKRTVAMGLDCFPDSFRLGSDQVPWHRLDNRPFLRAYKGYALELRERGQIEEALRIFEHLLALNPNDNQGVRALAVDAQFALNRPEAVLKLCDRYAEDAMDEIIYGRPLALLQLGRAEEAERALDEAIDVYPLIAEELTKTRHRKPPELRPDAITLWGRDQAYHYWKDQGQYWKKTPGAIELVTRCLQKLHR